MENELTNSINQVPIGKILIEHTEKTNEPSLHYYKFPEFEERTCFLLDDQVATGATAIMAIRVLLDHGVKEENIIFLSLVVSNLGLGAIYNAFPKVRIVTSAIEDYSIDDGPFIIAGMGDFAGRYFGS